MTKTECDDKSTSMLYVLCVCARWNSFGCREILCTLVGAFYNCCSLDVVVIVSTPYILFSKTEKRENGSPVNLRPVYHTARKTVTLVPSVLPRSLPYSRRRLNCFRQLLRFGWAQSNKSCFFRFVFFVSIAILLSRWSTVDEYITRNYRFDKFSRVWLSSYTHSLHFYVLRRFVSRALSFSLFRFATLCTHNICMPRMCELCVAGFGVRVTIHRGRAFFFLSRLSLFSSIVDLFRVYLSRVLLFYVTVQI